MQGGLGNQLFCLGFADTIARLTGEPAAIDIASFGADRYGHDFELKPLADRLGLSLTRRRLLSSRAVTAAMRALPGARYVSEPASPPDARGLAALAARGSYFNGYWQHEAYLAHGDFRTHARRFLLDQAGRGPERAVVIHCRTYKEEVRADRRAVPGADWFERCFAHLAAIGAETRDIALISDDPDLAIERLGDTGAGIEAVRGGTAWSDMALMLRARTLILTNSTFSWWGGYGSDAGTILYPAKGDLFHYAPAAARFTVVA